MSISEVKGRLSDYLSRVAAGERFVIERRQRPLAALISVPELERLERSVRAAERLALALGQRPELLARVARSELHPSMAAFALWRDADDALPPPRADRPSDRDRVDL